MKKEIISMLLAAFISAAILPATVIAAPAPDPLAGASDWSKAEGLAEAISAGIVPNSVAYAGWTNRTTRLAAAEAIVSVIEKALGKTIYQLATERRWDLNTNRFSDTGSHAVTFLRYAKVTDGVGGNRYDPGGAYNRAQVAAMIGRVAENIFGVTVSDNNPYTDEIPVWASPYVAYLSNTGITKGVSESTFDSYSVLQNQEIAIFSWRAFNIWRHIKPPEIISTRVMRKASPVDDSFFADAAIIGNSLVEGLRLYSGLTTCDYYGATSMTVVSAGNSVLQRLDRREYGKIYILLGINEIGMNSWTFKERYINLIDRIAAIQPGADIYIMGLTPVSLSKSNSSSSFNMNRVREYNERLYEIAEEKGHYYIDLCEALAGPDGYLPEGSTWDGVHLNAAYYKVWLEYLKYHYV